jgi:ABC-type multidrug transport system permease subunit
MSLLFIAQGMSGDLWDEQAQGTLRRALSAPPGTVGFVIGKVLAGAVLVAAVALVGLAVAVALFDVTPGRALVAWPWCAFGGTVLVALFLTPQVAAGSQRGANVLTTMLVFPLMMIGGSFFPFESMPGWMAAVGRWTPNGQGVARLKDILDGRVAAAPLAVAVIAMAVPACASVAFAARRLRRLATGDS